MYDTTYFWEITNDGEEIIAFADNNGYIDVLNGAGNFVLYSSGNSNNNADNKHNCEKNANKTYQKSVSRSFFSIFVSFKVDFIITVFLLVFHYCTIFYL